MDKNELKALIDVQQAVFKLHRHDINEVAYKLLKNKITYLINYDRKRVARKLVIYLIIAASVTGSWIYFIKNPITIILKEKANHSHSILYVQDSTRNMQAFLDKIGFMESGGNYRARNQFNFLGKYQFGRPALTAVGMGGISEDDFLNNPELQEVAMRLLLKKNKEFFARYIGKYQGRTIGGIKISESAILAAAQMSPQGVIDFIESNGQNVFKDGNGVPITKYLTEFCDYNLEF